MRDKQTIERCEQASERTGECFIIYTLISGSSRHVTSKLFLSILCAQVTNPKTALRLMMGRPRPRLNTLYKIAEAEPKNGKTVADVMAWTIGELRYDYHVTKSNCQHFAGNLWNEFASTSYPSPDRYLERPRQSPPGMYRQMPF